MSAVNESKIIHIKDEDLLKKMWHETEDFGRKKEIRAHMYKLREERLKDLYCNSDVKDIHLITNKKTSFNQSMHADALADHSFASLKRKEIRDSESPTKDISYRMKGPSINEGWNISKIEEHSQDGKNHKISQSAHTSGTEYIPQGKLDFEAKNNQELTTYHDGDDKNFVKSQGTSSNSFIRQEAVGGDGNSSFRTSSSQSSSSSRTVTEQKSTYGDAIDYPKQSMIDHGGNSNNFTSSTSVNTSRTDTNKDVGDYTRKQVILESANRDDQNNYRTSSTNATSSSKIVTESQKSQDDYSRKQVSDSDIIDRTTKVYTTDAPRELKSHPGYVEGRTKITRETKTLADGTVVTTTKYETKGVDEVKSASSNQYISSSSTFQDNKSNVITSKSHNENFSTQKVIEDRDKPSTKHQPKSRYYVEKTHTIPDTTENIHHNIQSRRESNVSEKKFDTTKNFQSHVDQRYEIINDLTEKRLDTKNTENVRNQTTQHIELEDSSNQRKENVRKETVDRNRVQQKTVATHDVNSVPLGTPIEIEINLTRINDNQEFKGREPQVGKQAVPKSAPENVYDTPKRREPIKHQDEITTKHKITDGQYDTTYRTDYTTKKISVEVSPTHDAFARSLRAVSPDRLSSRTSSRNLKSSNSSLRSSSSPEKSYTDRRHPQRMSPDRYTNGRYHSPTKKTPEKFSSTETITYKSVSRPNTQRISPDKSQRNKHTNEIKLTSNISTSTKKTEKTDDKTYKKSQSPPKNTPRTSIPNNEQRTNVYEITTDLDDNISTYSHSTVTTSKTDKRNSNVDSKTVEEFYINDRNKPVNENHPTKETPRKDKPIDRPLKRTDTYEERCRQILGITSDSNEKRRSSLEKLRKRGSTVQSPTDSPTKTSHESPEKKPHESPRQKSPTKQGVPLQEFPSQIRRSPEKCSPEKRTPKEPSPTKGRKPSVEGKNIQEYPSQTRKTPEKNDNTSFPRRSSDVRQERKPSNERKPIQEFPSQIRRTPEKYPPEDQNVTPKHTDSEKPSTHQKPLGEYPSQRHMSPDKKQSPSRSSPRKPNETNQETTNVDISSRTTSQLIMRDESENKNQATYSKDNIRIQTASNTSDTSYEQPSPTKHLPRKSLEKIAPAGSPDKHQRTTEVTTTLSSSLKNENITNITRNESLPDDGIPSIGKDRSKKPSHKEPTTTKHKPNNDSSSEENDIEVNQVKITEQVIYDIPRSAVHKISSDEVKTTDEERNTIILRTNINKQQNESNMKTITSDFISEEAQSLLIESAIDEQDDTETPLNTKRGPKDDKSPKSSQPIDKNQTKSKPFNLHDVRTVEQIDIVEDISMNKNTATEEKVTKSKTVGELVESFTLREEDNIRKPFEKPRDSYPNSCPMPKKSSLTKKYVNMVDVENSKITTNQIQINETIKQSSTDSKQPIQPKDGRPSSNEKPQKLDEIVKPNKYEDIELKKGSSINRTPTDKDLQKPSPQKTQKPDNEKDAKELVVETRSEFTLVSNKPSSTYIQKTNSRSPSRKPSEEKVQKSSKDSPHKRPQQDDNLMVIEVQETVTIESDEEIDESRQMFPSDSYPSQISKKIVHVQEDKEEYENSEESGHELTEIEFTTIKRIPNKESNEPLKKSPNKHQPQETKMPQKYDKNQKRDDKEIKQNTTNKTVVQKRIHTENISKEKDIKTLSQRTPSGSSLSKKPLIHQKLNKKEEVDVEVKNKVSTVRKSFERKQTKSDSVRKENAPHGRPMNGVPSKVHPSHKPISKKPLETVDKNKKPIKETPSNLDSDSSEAEEEIHTKKHVLETYEGRTPVEEPLIMKKTVSLLYSDDEDEKKATQLLIESEITEIQPITDQKKDRPTKSTKMTTTKLINSEKNERTVQKTKPSQKTPHQTNNMSKKPEIPKQPYLTNGVKKDTIKKETKQNTLKDIETFNTVNEDKKILLRSNRVDETVNKKKTSVMTTHGNTPINKSPDTPKTANGVPKRPSSRQTVTNEKITTRVTTKTKEPAKPTQKSNKPSIPQRSTMTSTVSSKTKTESKTTKTNAVKSNIKPVESKFKPKPKKIEEPEDSDEESLADSLDESVYSSMNDLTSTTQKTEIQTYTSENIEDLEKHQTSSVKSQFKSVDRTEKESESITEKKHKATKSIILNNKDRGTVDLQRSISSREPTPDRMCPLPVTSDEEGNAPRYPDKVVEPEESSPKKRYNRLFDTSIHEYGDIQSKKIVEINEDSNQKAIDRVDNDDESLLTVNKKINKFLSTAEKLTEKSVVDISQPAPKVHRPKFEVNDDLKEDDCLLSVSDKVQKFITEAEHLTTYKDTQHRKSVNVEVRSDVVDKINQFTSPQHQKEANLSPRKSSTPKNTLPSSFEETHPERKEPGKTTIPSQIKLDQDVFITTECAEIEKESDFFRASKNIPKDTKEKPEEHDTPKSSHESKSKKTEIKSTTKKTSVETDEFSYEDTQISEQTDETPTKPRKNSLKEFTPKNRRPSQEEKVILSSVGRLRSNESIKKAKALFDNTESSTREEKRQIDILNRPSVLEGRSKTVKETHSKKVIDRNNVTPKRLDFTTEKRTEDRQIKVESHKRQSSEKDVPRYMKPLDRQSKPEDDSHENPGYMKPLDRSHKHPQESAAPESQDQRNTPKHSVHGYESHKHYTSTDWTYKSSDTTEDNTPVYMKPLDRTDKHHHSQTLSNSDYQEHKYAPSHSVPEDHKRRPYTSNEDDTPGYMKPIDRSHQHHHTSSTPDSQEHRSRPRHSAPEDDNRKHHSSTDWTYKSGTNEDEIPGYMKPLDRSSRPQFDSREPSKSPERHTSSERYHEGDKPGYMEPLDRSSRPQFDRREPSKSPERHTISERYHEGDKPGYMQPLDRSSRPQFDSRDRSKSPESHTTSERYHEGDKPGYMEPLDRSSRPQFDRREPSKSPERHSISERYHEGDKPGYMQPLDRSSRPQYDSRDRSKSPESHTSSERYHKGDKPGYMEPLDRSSRPQFDRRKPSKSPERHTISERYHEGDKPGYMQPLDRSSRPQFDSRDRSKSPESHNTSERYHEGDKPGYMEPLDRSSRPQFDRRKPSISPERHSISERYHEGDKPGYMQPLDRSSRPQFDSRDRSKTPETHTTSERYHESDKPGYMEPLDRSSRPQFDRREPSKSPERHTISERYHDGDKPSYMQPLDRSTRPQYDSRDRSKSPETKDRYKKPHGYKPSESGPEEDLPGYMKPLDRCDRSRSPKKDTGVEKKPQDTSGTPTKFGVTLKRTDSSKAVTSPKTTTDKKHPLLLKKQITEEEIEEVFDLEVLEELLLKFTIYELRRKIRTQIRIVKKLISEGKLEVTIQNMKNSKKHTEHTLQTRENTKKTDQHSNVNSKNANSTRRIQESQSVERKNKQEFSEYTVESSRKESFSSTYTSERQDSRRSKTPEKKIQERRTSNGTTPERASPERKHSSKPSSERNIVEERTTSVQERRTSSRPTPERASPERKHSSKPSSERNIVEERTTSVQERRTSSRPTPERASPERKHSTKPSSERNIVEERTTSVQERRTSNRTTPERASPERKYSSKPSSERNIVEERTTSTHSTYTVKEKNKTGESKPPTKTSSPNIFNSSLKKTEPKVKSPTSAPQPEWITQRNLKKTGTNEVVKKSSVSSSSSTIKRQNIKSTSTKESESTDLIASSYGIGPTDENGAPLFGLRALRAQNTNGTTKVQGTVISSQYYSETGKEPVGQISVTKYSSDPRDLGSDEHSTRNGDILSVTTTQKYGYDDTPSLKQLTSTDQEICDSRTNKRKSSTKTSTITRKNSVKALTQKFVENAVEVSKSERQSTYPKAGLILRSSSFKNESATEDGYSEISAEKRMGESVSIKTSHSKSASGGTFLRNKSKVTDVQDAITRMKAEDIQHGDTEEDIEAKDLLNKYLGTQVILSGIEGQVSRTGASTEKATSFSTSAKSVSRITTVTMENGKEVTRTRTFEHPLSDEVLESVWDEQTLRYLLDQSTDYEERKRLRARLRLIMAEQEACTELVKQASQDQSSQSIDETIETSKEVVTEGPVTTTKVTRVSTQQHVSKKPMSPFAKFRQLDKQNSLNTPPSTPRTPGGSPLFKFTDAALSQSASTIKDRLLYWCRMKTKEYENIQLDNFSSSWADGLAFCALIHHFLPDAFDYHALTPKERRHNFTLAFKVADEKADIAPLLDVDDMVATSRPDWKCVFTYVQSIYRRFKDED
ncbi:microtubule-associated protein futsch isoform X2 [Coccinella septempunctata]|uniref:microtubule-associated protein futsch isoform X2 n=1 Tax=Coccinella septempunctata TaxID=41139 RepID=UPI001D05D64A|nr:microtubule-associated protein futsch isoform X2 [Coccinella septempunctata]